jgi:hypothetical protein
MPTKKVDLYKLYKAEYIAPRKPVLLKIAPAQYLSIDGVGQPGASEFQSQVGALYAMAFTIKMASKFAGADYAVCKLEGLWWDRLASQAMGGGDVWKWKLMIRTPPIVKQRHLKQAVEQLLAKGKDSRVRDVALETIREGRCVQMLHVGPYTQEAESIERMKQFAAEQDLEVAGRHHEIYLSDPRRVAPEKLRTILRIPLKKEA